MFIYIVQLTQRLTMPKFSCSNRKVTIRIVLNVRVHPKPPFLFILFIHVTKIAVEHCLLITGYLELTRGRLQYTL